jgi:TonB-dependent starch-binding outer membrane protein SusC
MKDVLHTFNRLIFLLSFTALGLSSGFSQSTASLAGNSAATGILKKNLEKPLKQALGEIETQYKAFIIYNLRAVENKFVATPIEAPASIEELLHKLLEPLDLKFERINSNVYVIVLPEQDNSLNSTSHKNRVTDVDNTVLSALGLDVGLQRSPSQEQNIAFTVRGKVTSEQGEGLPGVTVLVKGTAIGATTDVTGSYNIQAPDGNGVLTFSYIGYTTQEVPISNRSEINVRMVPDAKALSEVQVIGYGTQSKAEVTSAIASVSAEEIKDMPVVGLDQAIQGRAPGVQVTNNSGTPGGGVSIRIRGTSSLGAGNDPLYVVDGVPINNTQTSNQQTGEERINGMSNINPADIESIEILKDAASASIYGARAANGVVLITTKRGRAGKPQIDLTTWYGISQVGRRYNLLNASDFAVLANEGLATVNAQPAFTQDFINNPTYNTDWQDAIFQTAPTGNINLSTRGGNERTQYMLSAGYMDQQGIIIESRFKRYNARVNLDQKINDKIKIGSNLMASYTTNDRIRNTGGAWASGGDGNNLYGSPVLTSSHARSPATPVFDPVTGAYSFDPLAPTFSNPVAMAEAQDIVNNTIRLIGNIFGEWEIVKNLRFRSQLGTDLRYENEDFFFPPFPNSQQGNGTGRGSVRNYNEVLWLTENYLTYDLGLGQDHKFQALLGTSFQESKWESSFAYVSGFVNDKIKTLNGGSQVLQSTSDAQSWGIASYFGRLNYNFKNRYLFSLNARMDGSSRFGDNRKYGFFPAASIGWNLAEESFMAGISQVSNLKLRASYGITGNQEIGNFSHLGTIGVGGGANTGRNYLDRLGATVNNIPNDNFSWEQTAQFNAGTDLGILNNRISLTADYYIKTTSDLLLNIPLPRTSGFASTLTNIGKMENRGVELGLNTVNLDGDFTWNTNFNISFNRNKVISLVGGQDIVVRETVVREGEPISFWLFQREKYVDPEKGTTILIDQDGSGGAFNNLDRVLSGSPLPKHTGGFTNTFGYKGIDLSLFFQWSYGNKIYNQTRKWMEDMKREINSTIGYNTTQESFDDRWRQRDDVTEYPGVFYGTQNQNHYLPHNGWLEDGSYLRLKTLTLGYNLPKGINERFRMSNVRVYFTSNNLLTFTKYTGYDPEVSHFTSSGLGGNVAIGYDYGTFPQPKTYVLGLNLSF